MLLEKKILRRFDRVAIDRGLRLADKRSFPCPNRNVWLAARDGLYEEIMEKAWNEEHKWFGQSYEDNEVLDSAVLIMPLVFFMHAVINSFYVLQRHSDHRRLVRSEVRKHSQSDHEDTGEGGVDVQRTFSMAGFRARSD